MAYTQLCFALSTGTVRSPPHPTFWVTGQLKCDGTRAETRFRLSARNGRVHLNRPEGASAQSTTGSRGVRISGSNAGYTTFRGSVQSTGYPLHSPVSPLHSLTRASPCAITFSAGVYHLLVTLPVHITRIQRTSQYFRVAVTQNTTSWIHICFNAITKIVVHLYSLKSIYSKKHNR